jgi:hypothetical protein
MMDLLKRLSLTKLSIAMIPIILLTFATSLITSKPDKQKLVKELTSQLREERFEELYEGASSSLHLNVTKEKFIQRMKIAVTKMKAIDENLNFRRDLEMEEGFQAHELSILSIQELKKDGKSASVLIHWDTDGSFRDIRVFPTEGTAIEYAVYGVSYQHMYSGNQIVD